MADANARCTPALGRAGQSLTLLIFISLWAVLGSCTAKNQRTAVEEACHESVRGLLLSPSSAQFSKTEIHESYVNTYRVEGLVDASNAYGAMLRDRFFCIVEPPEARAFLGDDALEFWDELARRVRAAKRRDPNRLPPDVVSYQQYERLWKGMPAVQVEQLIGHKGAGGETTVGGRRGTVTTYEWKNYDGSTLRVEFKDGKLVDKEAIGLW